MTTLSIPAPRTRADAPIEGLDLTDAEWHLDTTRYRPFIEAVTGVTLHDDLSGADCYRIGNRLEALVDERRRQGEWTADLVDEYPVVESLREILWLARFFRRCHDCSLEAADA